MTSSKISSRKRYLSPQYLLAKVREKGVVWGLKTGLSRASLRLRGYAYNVLNKDAPHLLGTNDWLGPTWRFLLRGRKQLERRILLIWDSRAQPYSVGDLLVLHEVGLVLRLIYQVNKIDVCMVYDPQQPGTGPRHDEITSYNFHNHLTSLFPVVYLNPHLGSFMVFDSHDQLEKYISENIKIYYPWPSEFKYRQLTYLYYEAFHLFLSFYEKNGYLPSLSCRPVTLDWAYSFLEDKVSPAIPIVVHLRMNAKLDLNRNARVDAWLEFFHYCEHKYPAKFVVVGTARETDNRLRQCSNVIIAKDYQTNVEQDLALIQASAIFMGNASGPSTIAIFSQRPYIIVGMALKGQPGIVDGTPGNGFVFANENQRLIWERETTQILIWEFEDIFNRIDRSEWESQRRTAHQTVETSFYLS